LYESFPTIHTTQARSDRMPLPGKAGERWCEVRRIRQVAAIDWGAIGSGTIRTAALNIASKQARHALAGQDCTGHRQLESWAVIERTELTGE